MLFITFYPTVEFNHYTIYYLATFDVILMSVILQVEFE